MKKYLENWITGSSVIYYIAGISILLRGIGAASLELGNDEVYYVSYSRFIQLSYFDHPPFVGVLIWLGTLGNYLNSEWAIRFFSIILGTLNLFVIYKITLTISNRRSAISAVILSFSSVYLAVISGLFIMPDTGMVFFMFLALYQLVRIEFRKEDKWYRWIYFGLFCGLGFLSKIHILFLWGGVFLFAILYKRSWLLSSRIYLSLCITFILALPVFIWNYQNNFISFLFQSNRVIANEEHVHWDWLLREFFGSMAYNNPLVFLAIIVAILSLVRGRLVSRNVDRLFLCISLPLIFFFLIISLKHETLPHWSAPAYSVLIIPAGIIFSRYVYFLFSSLLTMVLVLSVGPVIVNSIAFDHTNTLNTRVGKFDFTLDMYGWDQISTGFMTARDRAIREGMIGTDSKILITKWFPGGHLAHYVAEPNGVSYYGIGSLNALHHFDYINRKLEAPSIHEWHCYITTSHFFQDPKQNENFLQYQLISEFPVYKGMNVVENVFVYRVRLKGAFDLQGHRGCRAYMPENSIIGFKKALDFGVTTLEMDCVVTKDSVVVVCHDLEILPALCEVKAPLLVYDMNFDELSSIKCGLVYSERFRDQEKIAVAIPSLEQVIDSSEVYAERLKRSQPFYNIEIKSVNDGGGILHPSHELFVKLICDLVIRKNIADRCVIQSFDRESLRLVRKQYPKMRVALLEENEVDYKKVFAELGFEPEIYSPNFVLVDSGLLKYCHTRGVKVIPWTVNDRKKMDELINLGVDGIITDSELEIRKGNVFLRGQSAKSLASLSEAM